MPAKLGLDRATRMEALEALETVAGVTAWGKSSSGPWRLLVQAIIMDVRLQQDAISPRTEVVDRCTSDKDVWDKVSPFIDKTGPGWKNFKPPTE